MRQRQSRLFDSYDGMNFSGFILGWISPEIEFLRCGAGISTTEAFAQIQFMQMVLADGCGKCFTVPMLSAGGRSVSLRFVSAEARKVGESLQNLSHEHSGMRTWRRCLRIKREFGIFKLSSCKIRFFLSIYLRKPLESARAALACSTMHLRASTV